MKASNGLSNSHGPLPSTQSTAAPSTEGGRLPKIILALVTAILLLLGICAAILIVRQTPSEDDTARARRTHAVQALLNDWAAALRSSDSNSIARLFDSSADSESINREVRKAVNLRALPLSDWGFELGSAQTAPLPQIFAARLGVEQLWAPQVSLRFAVDGIDSAPIRRPIAATVGLRQGKWRLVSTQDVPGPANWRGPWEFGPLTATTVADADGNRSIVVAHPQSADTANVLAKALPQQIAAIQPFVDANWSRQVLIVATASADEFSEFAGAQISASDAAAATVSDSVPPGLPPVGLRIVFAPDALSRLSEGELVARLSHELVHAAMRQRVIDGAPTWILEGFAEYVSRRGSVTDLGAAVPQLAKEIARSGPPRQLPSDAEFVAVPDHVDRAYEMAWTMCDFVAAEFGEAKLIELHSRLAGIRNTPEAVDAAVRAVLGLHTDDLVLRWSGWLATKV